MNPFLLVFCFLSTLGGTFVVLSSSHWFFIWVGLEINTLGFLPMLGVFFNPRAVEASIKYFLVQALGSALLLLGGLLSAFWSNTWFVEGAFLSVSSLFICFVALAIKLAIPPCHSWYPDVIQGIPLLVGLMLSTWQKIAPFYLLFCLCDTGFSWVLVIVGSFAAMLGGWGGLNQTQIRKLLAYSSIGHMGWTIAVLPFSGALGVLNLVLYFLMSMMLFQLFNFLWILNLAKLGSSVSVSPWVTVLILLVTLSLAGLPPFTGFLGKWFIMKELSFNLNFLCLGFLIGGNLLSLFYYLRVAYVVVLTVSPQHVGSMVVWRGGVSLGGGMFSFIVILSICALPLGPVLLFLSGVV